MSIIDKLGISKAPWDIRIVRGQYDSEYCIGLPVDDEHMEIIAAAPEMLEALIEGLLIFEDGIDDGYFVSLSSLSKADIMKNSIEKATGKSWEEIKSLID